MHLQQNYPTFIDKEMHSQRKRQQSLKQLPTLKKSQTFPHPSPPKISLPTVSQHREAKKSSTKDLTHIISKFLNMNKKQTMKYSEELARCGIAVLRAFSVTENNFQELFLEMYGVMRRYIFAIDDKELQGILEMYKVREGFSYRRTCFLLEKELENVMKDKQQKLQEVSQNYHRLRNDHFLAMDKWQQKQKFLESEVERYRKLADIQYMRSLEQKVQQLKATVSELELQTTRIAKQNEQYLKQIDFKDNKIHDQAYEIAKLKADLFDARDKIDKTDMYFNQMRDRFDQLLVKMLGLKQIIAKVEQENSILVSERMKMVNRAAVAFEQLTPRPKYKQICGTNLRENGMSTQEIFASMASNSEENKKSIIQIMKQKRKNQRLQDAEAVRNKVVDDIILAKKEMEKIQNL